MSRRSKAKKAQKVKEPAPPNTAPQPTTTPLPTEADVRPPATLDWQLFPHIFDLIVMFSDYDTVMNMYLTSSKVVARVAPLILRHIVADTMCGLERYVPGPLPPALVHDMRSDYHLREKRLERRLPIMMVPQPHDYPTFATCLKTLDMDYHNVTPWTPPILMFYKLPSLLENVKVVRHRFINGCEGTSDICLPITCPTTDIWFVNLYLQGVPQTPFIPGGLGMVFLPGASASCTTAIFNVRFDFHQPLPLEFQLEVEVHNKVSHIVILCTAPEDTVGEPSTYMLNMEHGLCVRREVASVAKAAMVHRDVRLTVVNLKRWHELRYIEGYSDYDVDEVFECFLGMLDVVEPEWPNDRIKERALKNVRFLELDEWRREVGNELYNLAMVE